MSQPLVSIIIPFYNEEQFLKRAVFSALAQSYPAIEIILVNDGSDDDSINIARSITQDYPQIVLIDSTRNSLGKARNLGIDKASGEFIAFLDSDDELEHQAIEKLVGAMLLNKADIVVCRFSYFNSKGDFFGIDGWDLERDTIDGNEAACKMYEHKIASTAWAKLYRTGSLREISFPEQVWFEDRPFVLSCFLKSKKVFLEQEPLFKIYSRPQSITRRVLEPKRIEDSAKIFLLELKKTDDDNQKLRHILYRHHLRVLVGNALILYSDRNKISGIEEVQSAFHNSLNEYHLKLKQDKIRLGRKDYLNLLLMNGYRYVGWKMWYKLVSVFKHKKMMSITKLRLS